MSSSRDHASVLTRQDMLYNLGEVYNRSVKVGMVTRDQLPEVLTQVRAWRAALKLHDQNEEVRASETFKALTACLQRGRSYPDAPGNLIDTLPLGQPQLEGSLWHLWQVAYRPGATDREKLEALDGVLRAAGGVPSPGAPNAEAGDVSPAPRLPVAEQFDPLKEAERFGVDLFHDLARVGSKSADRVNLLLHVATAKVARIPYQTDRISLAAIPAGIEPRQRVRDRCYIERNDGTQVPAVASPTLLGSVASGEHGQFNIVAIGNGSAWSEANVHAFIAFAAHAGAELAAIGPLWWAPKRVTDTHPHTHWIAALMFAKGISEKCVLALEDRERLIASPWAASVQALRLLLAHSAPPGTVERGEGDRAPVWIREHFGQKQYKLLSELWGKGDVESAALASALGYTRSATAEDNLRRRVTETNRGLCQKANLIGKTFEISQRRRDGVLYYYLHPVGS